jgi:hypothetical protein
MTNENCAAACAQRGYKYAGTEDGNSCFCGNSYGRYGTSKNCTVPCSGNSTETCGGGWANSVFATGASGHVAFGCFADRADRDLPYLAGTSNTMTNESCVASCVKTGYKYAGVQAGIYCFCGNAYGRYGTSSCAAPCPGDARETCGGTTWANNVFATGLSGAIGCYADSAARVLPHHAGVLATMTNETCVNLCVQAGYKYAGTESENDCFCGNALPSAASTACTTTCSGDPGGETCGGWGAITVFATGL